MTKTTVLALLLFSAMPVVCLAAEGDAAVAVAATVAKAPAAEGAAEAPVKNVDGSYLIKSGDKVNIKIFPEDQYVRGGQFEVTPEGNITLPLIGKITVADKTITQASEDLRKVIDEDYIIGPEVVIEILGYKLENFVILGQVQKPGTYNIPAAQQGFTFLQAVSTAGGFSQVANIKKIKIIRQQGGERKIIRINAESIIGGEDQDIEIQPGDVIHVSESLF